MYVFATTSGIDGASRGAPHRGYYQDHLPTLSMCRTHDASKSTACIST